MLSKKVVEQIYNEALTDESLVIRYNPETSLLERGKITVHKNLSKVQNGFTRLETMKNYIIKNKLNNFLK